MKVKTINLILRKKFVDFLESIEDKNVRELVEKNSIITGGAIASMLLREHVNDYDIYFTNKKTVEAVAKYYVEKFKELGNNIETKGGIRVPIYVTVDEGKTGRVRIYVKSVGIAAEGTEGEYEYFETDPDPQGEKAADYVERAFQVVKELEDDDKEKPKYRPVFLTSNAITLSDGVQLVIRFYGDSETIHKNYDYVHCTNYWSSKDQKLMLNKEALACLITRELRYTGSKYPVCSVMRLRKFLQRGWKITAGQIVKMALQISELDLTNLEVLEDQLIGVDVAYFIEIITALRERQKDQEDINKVDTAYLLEILDRVF